MGTDTVELSNPFARPSEKAKTVTFDFVIERNGEHLPVYGRVMLDENTPALSAESKNVPWPITERWSATTWHRSVSEARYDDQFIKLRRALGIIAGTKVVTT